MIANATEQHAKAQTPFLRASTGATVEAIGKAKRSACNNHRCRRTGSHQNSFQTDGLRRSPYRTKCGCATIWEHVRSGPRVLLSTAVCPDACSHAEIV